MPSMANITVKNRANADVVFVAKTPSSGDRVAARWMVDAASDVIGFRPTFNTVTRDNGAGNGRVLESNFMYPHTITPASGIETLAAKTTGKAQFTLPTNVDSSAVEDAFWIFVGAMHSELLAEIAGSGYAPT